MSTRLTVDCLYLSLVLCVFVSGCGKDSSQGPTGSVTGTVTIDGKPLTSGSVEFFRKDGGASDSAKVDDKGQFKIESLPVGEYQVSFHPPQAPQPEDEATGKLASKPTLIHVGYQDASSSGETRKVTEGENSFEFKLRKQGPPRTGSSGMTPP